MHSFFASWRLSLRRTRADWPIVAASLLIIVLATTLFAAGPIYSSAAALAGLRRTLADAPPTQTSVQVSVYGTPADVASFDSPVQAAMQSALSPLSTTIVRDGRDSATLALPTLPGSQSGDQAALGFLDGLPDHAKLTQGAWPADTTGSDPLQVVVLDTVAAQLQIHVGDQLTLIAPNFDQPVPLPVQLVGTYSIDDPTDPYWYGDAQLTTGVSGGSGDHVYGPFMTTPDSLLANPALTWLTSVHIKWNAFADFDGLTVDNVAGIHDRLAALATSLPTTKSGSFDVATNLPVILASAERSLLVSRTEMLLLMAQLAIMAAYAIALTATLLVDHRRVETALLRSRGAGSVRISWLALAEGLILVVPAVLIAPWLAVAESSALNFAGPLADIGLPILPTVTSDSYLLALAAGIGCLLLLVLPAFLASRSLTSEERELSRQETRTFGQRLGLDVTLLVISAIALWQLQLYGAPLTQTVQGSLGFDPLLVAAPAIGLLAGGILALRVLPLLAVAMEKSVSRGRELVATLGARHLARRPLRYTRTALLLILAVSLGVFAVSYAATWSSSQQDQAGFQAGADVRAVVATRPGIPPLPSAYAAIPGVEAAMPVERIDGGVSVATGRVDVLALDADTATSVVKFRADEATQSLDQLMGVLYSGRPDPQLVTLPNDTAYLRVTPLLDISKIFQLPTAAAFAQSGQPTPYDPDTALSQSKMSAIALVRDVHGLIYQIASQPVSMADPGAAIVLPLVPTAPTGSQPNSQVTGHLDGPLELAGLEVKVSLPTSTLTTSALLGVGGLAAGSGADGPWTDLPLDGWSARMAQGSQAPTAVPASNVQGMAVQIDNEDNRVLIGGPAAGRALFISSALGSFNDAVPAVVNPAFLAATGTAPGQTITVTIDNAQRNLTIAGTVGSFPTTDSTKPLLLLDEPTLDLLRVQASGSTRNVDEWWMNVDPAQSAQVSEALRAEPFDSSAVVSVVDRTRDLSTDPVALGIIGALLLGFVATGIFALVALVVSAAVSARQRRTEFALLRALGLSGGQLSRWLWLENGSLVLVSLVAGTCVGIVMSLIALPFITVTQQATAPVPGVLVRLPWDRIIVLDLIVVVALGISVAILAAVMRRIGVGSVLRLGDG